MDIKDRILEMVVDKLVESRLDELSTETLKSYHTKASKQKPKKGSNRAVGVAKAAYRISKSESGSNKRKNVLGSKSKGNKAYVAAKKKEGQSNPPLSIDKINQMGVRKTHDTAANDAAEKILAAKTNALAGSAMKDATKQGKQDKKNRLKLMTQILRKRKAARG